MSRPGGLGCDGLLLDTVDTCAPNSYTDDSFPGKTRFEWTAPGVSSFLERLRTDYPDAYILQNRPSAYPRDNTRKPSGRLASALIFGAYTFLLSWKYISL